jgi:predicted  nucleic acid-binding Zn-ribbon protein
MPEPVQATGAADIVNIKCNCCGRMIPSKPYVKVVRGRTVRFCGNDCYRLYLSYKLKRAA